MDAYEFKARLLATFPKTELTQLSSEQLLILIRENPGVSDEYISLLKNVGYGALAECTYAIYPGPVSPSCIYGTERGDALVDVALIGDDFCGYCLGYRCGQLGEVSASGEWQPINGKTLIGFLSERVFEGAE